jgi:hypothetical protein
MELERNLLTQLRALTPDGQQQVLDFVQFLRQKETHRRQQAALAMLRAAPHDDEPDTPTERAEAAEARADYQLKGGVSADEARRRLS